MAATFADYKSEGMQYKSHKEPLKHWNCDIHDFKGFMLQGHIEAVFPLWRE